MGATIIDGAFEWDADKATSNLAKHDVSFEEAVTVFGDEASIVLDDGSGADRCVIIGFSSVARTLLVVFVEVAERDRIIGARKATKAERALYGAKQ